jgi:hypothetical protein
MIKLMNLTLKSLMLKCVKQLIATLSIVLVDKFLFFILSISNKIQSRHKRNGIALVRKKYSTPITDKYYVLLGTWRWE